MDGRVHLNRAFYFVLLLLAIVAGVVGCNTVHGAGEDMKATGQVIQDVFTR